MDNVTEPTTQVRSGDKIRLILASVALVAWLGFLANLSWKDANMEAVSQPQILTAPIIFEGKLLIDPPRVEVTKVLHQDANKKDEKFITAEIQKLLWQNGQQVEAGKIYNLVDPPLSKNVDLGRGYFLAVYRVNDKNLKVYPVPGYHSENTILEMPIYPANESNRRQIEALLEYRSKLDQKRSK